jgi:hypothetical protein
MGIWGRESVLSLWGRGTVIAIHTKIRHGNDVPMLLVVFVLTRQQLNPATPVIEWRHDVEIQQRVLDVIRYRFDAGSSSPLPPAL